MNSKWMEFQTMSLLHSLDFFGEVPSCLFKIQPWTKNKIKQNKIQPWAAIQTFTNYLVIWAVIFCLTFLWTSIVLKLFQHEFSRLYIYLHIYILTYIYIYTYIYTHTYMCVCNVDSGLKHRTLFKINVF